MAERLAEAEVMERNFLMSVSHELRTPLTAIRGHVSALLEGVVDDPELEQASLEIVEAEATRLERLVGDILDLAKLDTHRFTVLREEVDMGTLLDQAYETYRDEARRRGDRLQPRGARPAGDHVRRRPRVAGRRQPSLQRVPGDAGRRAHLARARPAERVGARGGRGLGAGHRARGARASLPCVHLGVRPQRHGLGLAIAKELSAALGGRIDLESEVGKGSRFELVLPATLSV